MPLSNRDRDALTAVLGRAPRAECEVVVRNASGAPAVLRNAPFMDDGTPMPTRFWLVEPELLRLVSALEAAGGVRAAELAIDPDRIAEAHARHAAARDAEVPEEYTGPRPFGGVGGTRIGVKCLHAHYAAFLAGDDDPVGAWVADRLVASGADDDRVHP